MRGRRLLADTRRRRGKGPEWYLLKGLLYLFLVGVFVVTCSYMPTVSSSFHSEAIFRFLSLRPFVNKLVFLLSVRSFLFSLTLLSLFIQYLFPQHIVVTLIFIKLFFICLLSLRMHLGFIFQVKSDVSLILICCVSW